MTSRSPDYAVQPAFVTAVAAAPGAYFPAARLVSYVTGLPLGPKGYSYSNTNYILAQMIIERVTHDSYADQLTRRIIIPLGLDSMCYAPYTCPGADAARCRPGTSTCPGHRPCWANPLPLALTWAQGAGAIVTSLQDMTTWDRNLYQGRELPPRQQRQLESLVSETTGQPIADTTPADPAGYGLARPGDYHLPADRNGVDLRRRDLRLPGGAITTSPAPASSSRSPSTAQPTQPTTNRRAGDVDTRHCKGRRSTRGLNAGCTALIPTTQASTSGAEPDRPPHRGVPCRARFLIRKRDGEVPGPSDVILADAGIDVVRSGVRMLRMNSIMERWVQTCRRELLEPHADLEQVPPFCMLAVTALSGSTVTEVNGPACRHAGAL